MGNPIHAHSFTQSAGHSCMIENTDKTFVKRAVLGVQYKWTNATDMRSDTSYIMGSWILIAAIIASAAGSATAVAAPTSTTAVTTTTIAPTTVTVVSVATVVVSAFEKFTFSDSEMIATQSMIEKSAQPVVVTRCHGLGSNLIWNSDNSLLSNFGEFVLGSWAPGQVYNLELSHLSILTKSNISNQSNFGEFVLGSWAPGQGISFVSPVIVVCV